MTKRVILGKRGSEYGIWVSKPGYNVQTATNDQLLLNISQAVDQVIMIGTINSFPTVVPLGLSVLPYVFINSTVFHQSTDGSSYLSNLGYMRPFPFGDSTANTTVIVTTAEMVFNSGGSFFGYPISVHYVVFRRRTT